MKFIKLKQKSIRYNNKPKKLNPNQFKKNKALLKNIGNQCNFSKKSSCQTKLISLLTKIKNKI